MVGKVISHYEIVQKLGQGGMGVVYKARDLKLSRLVAIKMLSPEFASDPDRRKRLIKEAQAASSLNHPHICTIHEIDEADGAIFVVMEWIQGHTLADEMSKGRMTLSRILEIAIQIAEGLEKAHGQFIIHRDIKPSNILITEDGNVKIVDFGLARILIQNDTETVSRASTMEQSLTEAGQVVGTIHFLSPEQIRGAKADGRSDIFSFGVVLYSMLTNSLPFPGKTVFEIISSILSDEPEPVSKKNLQLPNQLDEVLAKTLAKIPDQRYGSIKELIQDLKTIQGKTKAESIIPQDSGRGLGTKAKSSSSKHAIKIPPATEKKHVTIAVCQLAGYAELIEHLPGEEAEIFLKQIQDAAEGLVRRQDGILNHFSGEEMMLIFGLPLTREDDCLRAVRVVLNLHSVIRQHNLQMQDRIGQAIHLQSGISTGLALAELLEDQEQKYKITGNAVQLAARLAARADLDEILVSPDSYRLITPYFETTSAEPLSMKGKSGPIKPYRILGESGMQSRLEASQKTGFTPFTGRNNEMNLLLSCLEKAQFGEGQFVSVSGDAGIGKSRLLYEFGDRVDGNSTQLLMGRCPSHAGTLSYAPFIEILKDLLRIQRDDLLSPEVIVARVHDIDPSLDSFIPIYLNLLLITLERYTLSKHLQGEDLRLAIGEAFSAIFTLSARKTPTVFVLEDWHQSDEASREVLRQLADMIPGYPILILAAFRPEPSIQVGGFPNHTSIQLRPLNEALSFDIIKSVLNVDHFPHDLGKLIHDRTGGNPFFLEEICHTLQEEGKIQCQDRKAILIGTADQFRLPDTVEAVIRTRLNRLDPDDEDVLRVASVIGREFQRSVLQNVLQESTGLVPSLENLKNMGLIQQIQVLPESVYKFKHALIHEVAYESLLGHRRKDLHDRTASVMESLSSDHAEDSANVLAYHFGQAENWEKAVRYGKISAEKAISLAQFSEALQLEEKIYVWSQKLPEKIRQGTLSDTLLSQERLCETLGKRERQQQIINELKSIVESIGDETRLAEVYRREADLNTLLHRFDAAEEAVEKSLGFSRKLLDRTAERNALTSLGFLRWYQGDYKEASAICEKVISMDREQGDLQNLASALTSHGNILRRLKDYERCLKCLEEALEIFEEKMDHVKQCATLNVIGSTYRDQQRNDTALYYFKRAAEISSKNQLFIPLGFNLMSSANMHWQLGNVEESLRIHKEALATYRKSRHADGLVQSLRALAEILVSLGRNAEALPYYQESADLFAQLGDQEDEAKMRLNAARILEQGEYFAEAVTNWNRIRSLKSVAGDISGELESLEALARVSRLKGDPPSKLMQLYREALVLAEKQDDPSKIARQLYFLGGLEWNRGDYENALARYQRAMTIFEESSDEVHLGLMLNSIGATLVRLGRLEEAKAHLKRAIEINRQTEERLLEGHSWATLGEVWYKSDKFDEALQCYQTSLQIRKNIGDRKGEGWMQYYLAQIHSALGATKLSKDSLIQAVRIAVECADQELQNVCNSALKA